MEYQEYIATVTVEIMGQEFTFTIPYLEEPYDQEDIYEMAIDLIREEIVPISYTIKPMESEVSYA